MSFKTTTKYIISALFILISTTACSSPSGKSGFILDGKEYVLYKDGKAVKKYRELASAKPSPKVLYFQEDKFARCYYLDSKSTNTSRPLQCIKKK